MPSDNKGSTNSGSGAYTVTSSGTNSQVSLLQHPHQRYHSYLPPTAVEVFAKRQLQLIIDTGKSLLFT